MIKWLERFSIGQIKNKDCSYRCSVMAYHYWSVPLAATGIPYLSRYLNEIIFLFVKYWYTFCLKFYPDRRHLPWKNAPVIPLQDIRFAYSDMSTQHDFVAKLVLFFIHVFPDKKIRIIHNFLLHILLPITLGKIIHVFYK